MRARTLCCGFTGIPDLSPHSYVGSAGFFLDPLSPVYESLWDSMRLVWQTESGSLWVYQRHTHTCVHESLEESIFVWVYERHESLWDLSDSQRIWESMRVSKSNESLRVYQRHTHTCVNECLFVFESVRVMRVYNTMRALNHTRKRVCA